MHKENENTLHFLKNTMLFLSEITTKILALLIMVVLLASLGGIAVATIVKKLDNIVKIYSAALANMFTAIACSILFPNKFTLSIPFGIALVLMFTAVFLYERKHIDFAGSDKVKEIFENICDKLKWVFEWKLLQAAIVSLTVSVVLAVIIIVFILQPAKQSLSLFSSVSSAN